MTRIKLAILALAVVLGVSVGSTFALWHDEVTATGSIKTARALFEVGPPGGAYNSSTTDASVPTFTFGTPTQATTLRDNGAIAIPIQVNALANGNKGMRYELGLPTLTPGTFFGESTVGYYKVANAAACTTALTGPNSPLTSEPDNATYSAGTTPAIEFWCVVAKFTDPDAGTYSNTAVASGTFRDPVSSPVSNTWTKPITTAMDPASEPSKNITFDPDVFRPGG